MRRISSRKAHRRRVPTTACVALELLAREGVEMLLCERSHQQVGLLGAAMPAAEQEALASDIGVRSWGGRGPFVGCKRQYSAALTRSHRGSSAVRASIWLWGGRRHAW